jgi:hypothetical protein
MDIALVIQLFPFFRGMKEIPLTQGKVAIVDDCDFEWLNQWNWCAAKDPRKTGDVWYAIRHGPSTETPRRTIRMHREIAARAGLPQVDHSDGNGLHNWRSNLRPCTATQNNANMRKRPETSSQFKGVTWRRDTSVWKARIRVNRNLINLGCFTDEIEAAKAYDTAAREHFGGFACLNFP